MRIKRNLFQVFVARNTTSLLQIALGLCRRNHSKRHFAVHCFALLDVRSSGHSAVGQRVGQMSKRGLRLEVSWTHECRVPRSAGTIQPVHVLLTQDMSYHHITCAITIGPDLPAAQSLFPFDQLLLPRNSVPPDQSLLSPPNRPMILAYALCSQDTS